MHLVLIETSGNQQYIFETNKLRENVGASEWTYRVGTEFVLDPVKANNGPDLWDESTRILRMNLKDINKNPPLENSKYDSEVILAVSGKAILLVKNKETGRKIIQSVTCCALKKAPGLHVTGVIGEEIDINSESNIHQPIKDIHGKLEVVRSQIPGPVQRFLRLPVVAECTTSGLPAKKWATEQDDKLPPAEQGPRSAVSLAKQSKKEYWYNRIKKVLSENQSNYTLPGSTTELEEELGCDWFAVIHADGNGLGQVFLNFDQYAKKGGSNSNRDYINKLRNFSLALDECTENAFCTALGELNPKQWNKETIYPIVPLVLGGDDLTLVCDGKQAMSFTKSFIESFEEKTDKHHDINIIKKPITCSAGIAIIKPHFPFYAAYQLAEELLKSAKTCKPKSAIDFHVLYDASGPDLDRIREALKVDHGKTSLTARPYYVDKDDKNKHSIEMLCKNIFSISSTDEEGNFKLPNSTIHELREGLFLGEKAADARLQLALGRHNPSTFKPLIHSTNGGNYSLFWKEKGIAYTGLLDAIELKEFWKVQKQ